MRYSFLFLLLIASLGAAAAMETGTCAAPGGENPGYRVHHYVRDPALHAAWAVLVDCLHPESPAKVVTIAAEKIPYGQIAGLRVSPSNPAQFVAAQPFEVKAGSTVRVWMANGSTQMSLEAVALGGGAHGASVPIRLMAMSGSRAVLHGTVRGPGVVELGSPKVAAAWRNQP